MQRYVPGVGGIRTIGELARFLPINTEFEIEISLLVPTDQIPSMGGHRCSNASWLRDQYYMWGGGGWVDKEFVIAPTPSTVWYWQKLYLGECMCGLEVPKEVRERAFMDALPDTHDPTRYYSDAEKLAAAVVRNPNAAILFRPLDYLDPQPVEVSYGCDAMEGENLHSVYLILSAAQFSAIAS